MKMTDALWLNLGAGYFLMIAMMAVVWGISLKIKNAGVVDVAWAIGFSILVIFYNAAIEGQPLRKALILAVMLSWNLRLAYHLFTRLLRMHPVEDIRYQKFRNAWTSNTQLKFFGFFQAQAILIAILSVPVLLILSNPNPEVSFLEWAGLALFAIGLFGESVADAQLAQFKMERKNEKALCERGLWNYSRHPNYFFEWVNWCALFAIALSSPYGWLTLYAPLLMFYILTKVTGIPLTEEMAVQSKGEAYLQYQKSTSAFIPWFKKTNV